MFVCIYRPPKQDSQYFLGNLPLIIDHYSSIYDNHIILGGINMEPKNPKLASFMHTFNLYNLIKSNTCFKGSGSYINLILTNRKYCFKHTSTFETGLSNHHHLIYSMSQTTSKKEESKHNNCPKKYENFEKTFENLLSSHGSNKTKFLGGNQKPHIDYKLRKAIMKPLLLKNKANKTKQLENITQYMKKRNLVVKLNRESKTQYFDNIQTYKNSKHFWNKSKPYFSNKHAHGVSKIILIKKERIIGNKNEIVKKETLLVNNDTITETVNNHFSETVEKLNTFK